MRTAIVMTDVLPSDGGAAEALARLADKGLRPVVVVLDGQVAPEDVADVPVVCSPLVSPACWDAPAGLIQDALGRVGGSAPESFFFCRDTLSATRAARQGCRPMLVLGDDNVDAVFGDRDPSYKSMAVAPDLDTAVRYALEEQAQASALGPFPFGGGTTVAGRLQPVVPSPRELALIFGLVTAAGIAVALGIAYLLQEIYQTVEFPPIAYYISLQFIPQTLRGVLFLVFGAILGFMAPSVLRRLSGRYWRART